MKGGHGRWYLTCPVSSPRRAMRADIHPDYVDTTVTCGCGETFKTRSTRAEIRVEICSRCHPFYTGKQKFVDTAGRIEKFEQKWKKAKEKAKG